MTADTRCRYISSSKEIICVSLIVHNTTERKANIYVPHQERPISMYHTRKGQYLKANIYMYVPNQERPISIYTCMYQTRKGQYLHVCTTVKGQYLHGCTTVKGQYLCTTPRKANIYVLHQERPISIFMHLRKKGQYLCTPRRKANIYVPLKERPMSMYMYMKSSLQVFTCTMPQI